MRTLSKLVVLIRRLLIVNNRGTTNNRRYGTRAQNYSVNMRKDLYGYVRRIQILNGITIMTLNTGLVMLLRDDKGNYELRASMLNRLLSNINTNGDHSVTRLLGNRNDFLSTYFFCPATRPPGARHVFFFRVPGRRYQRVRSAFCPPYGFPCGDATILGQLRRSRVAGRTFQCKAATG